MCSLIFHVCVYTVQDHLVLALLIRPSNEELLLIHLWCRNSLFRVPLLQPLLIVEATNTRQK
jgi:hypothetical protein